MLDIALDVVLALISAALTGYLAWKGIEVSLRPPKKSDDLGRRKIRKQIQWVAATAILLIGIQALRNSLSSQRVLRELQNQGNAQLYIVELGPTANAWRITPGGPMFLNAFVGTRGTTTAYDAHIRQELYLKPGLLDGPTLARLSRAFLEGRGTGYRNEYTSTVTPQLENFRSIGVPALSIDQATGLLSGMLKVYLLTAARWRNPSGSESHMFSCMILHGRIQDFHEGGPEAGFDCTQESGVKN